jgi:hypothetical protein
VSFYSIRTVLAQNPPVACQNQRKDLVLVLNPNLNPKAQNGLIALRVEYSDRRVRMFGLYIERSCSVPDFKT